MDSRFLYLNGTSKEPKIVSLLFNPVKTPVSRVARISERIVNQNTFHELADDFKFFNDTSDEFRENGEGTLLPLWKYNYSVV